MNIRVDSAVILPDRLFNKDAYSIVLYCRKNNKLYTGHIACVIEVLYNSFYEK